MTATVNQRGQIVLRTTAQEKVRVKTGDVLVVVHDQSGRIVLQKRPSARPGSKKSYLTPPALSSATLDRIYTHPTPDWEKVEAEAVAISRRALAGETLEDL